MLKILLIGAYPPPFGGVSVHIHRLYNLYSSMGYNVKVICNSSASERANDPNILSVSQGFNWKSILRQQWHAILASDVVYTHSNWNLAPLVLFGLIIGKKAIMTFHDQMFHSRMEFLPRAVKWSVNIIIHLQCTFIAVNKNIVDHLVDTGVSVDKICLLPAYIPYIGTDKNSDSISCLLSSYKNDHWPILVVYGWRVSFINTDDGKKDLYGFDTAAAVIDYLRSNGYPEVGLILLIPGETMEGQNYVKKLYKGYDVLNIYEPINNMSVIWSVCDLYLRPTLTDGDSLSIREALAAGCKVVASNCVERPTGVTVYSNNNANSAVILSLKENCASSEDIVDYKKIYSNILCCLK